MAASRPARRTASETDYVVTAHLPARLSDDIVSTLHVENFLRPSQHRVAGFSVTQSHDARLRIFVSVQGSRHREQRALTWGAEILGAHGVRPASPLTVERYTPSGDPRDRSLGHRPRPQGPVASPAAALARAGAAHHGGPHRG